MDQQFTCPHCRQLLVLPSFATAQQVQCPHCSGLFTVAASADAKSAPSTATGKAAGGPATKVYLLAGSLLVAMAVLPTLGYGLFWLVSPAKSSTKSTAVAQADGKASDGSNAGSPGVVLTGKVILNDESQKDENQKTESPASQNNPSAVALQSTPPAPAVQPYRAPTAASPTPTSPRPASPAPSTPAPRSAPGTEKSPEGAPSDLAAPAAASGPADTTALIQQIEPSVVVVQVTLDKSSSIGSGFPLDDRGTIVTNYHVIEGAKSVKIKFGDKTVDVQGFLVFSPGKDIAILKADLGPHKLAPLKLAAGTPAKGETVLTFGAPLGFDSTVSNGIVSSVRKGSDLREIFKNMVGSDVYVDDQHYDLDAVWVQTTAPISGGNSGGPLVNLKGEVVGLNTWHLVKGQNMNFAISADHIKEMMKSAVSGVQPLANLPKPREPSFAAGTGKRTLEYWDEVSRINRSLATRLKKIRQPPLPNTPQKLTALFPKLAGIYKKLGDVLPEAAGKLKALNIDDVDGELVGLVTVDAMNLEKIGEAARDMATDIKLFRAEKVYLYDAENLAKKAFGSFEDLELGQAYDVLRIRLTNRYSLTFASIFDASRNKSAAKADDEDDDPAEEATADADPQREKQAAGKLKLARQLKEAGKREAAKDRLRQIVDEFAGTKAAAEAQELLDELGGD
jgi:S1-C subfamily serine protease